MENPQFDLLDIENLDKKSIRKFWKIVSNLREHYPIQLAIAETNDEEMIRKV